MFSPSLSAEQQRELAKRITSFLSLYTHISDSYIIVRLILSSDSIMSRSMCSNGQVAISLQEFFSEDLWKSLPGSWQLVLQDLSYRQTADLLLDSKNQDRR